MADVAGVVLGAISVAISGLEHYANVVDGITKIKNAAREYRTVAIRFRTQETIFRNTLTLLLGDQIDSATLEQLLTVAQVQASATQCPHAKSTGHASVKAKALVHAAWFNPVVTTALRERLQSSYAAYVDQAQDLQRHVDIFTRRLCITSDGKGPFDGPRSFAQAYKRLGIPLELSSLDKTLLDIERCNVALSTLTQQTSKLWKTRLAHRAPYLAKFGIRAANVFDSLQTTLRYLCATAHKASICLKTSSIDLSRHNTLEILLHHVQTPHSATWMMEEVEVKLASQNEDKRRRRVAFKDIEHHDSKDDDDDDPNLIEVHDLCQRIQSFDLIQTGACFGYVTSAFTDDQYWIWKPDAQVLNDGGSNTSVHSLDAIIEGNMSINCSLTGVDAQELAVILALGMYQLGGTPWLKSSWTKSDILIAVQDGKLLSTRPYISRDLHEQAYFTTRDGTHFIGSDKAGDRIIRHRSLFALGIILIELCLGKAIDLQHARGTSHCDRVAHEETMFKTATDLLESDEILKKFGEQYDAVVKRCIYCSHAGSRLNLTGSAFKDFVYNDIILELQEARELYVNGLQPTTTASSG